MYDTPNVTKVEDELSFIRLSEVLKLSTMSRSTVYAAIKRGEFPPPVKIGDRSVWVKREVLGWMESCIRRRNS